MKHHLVAEPMQAGLCLRQSAGSRHASEELQGLENGNAWYGRCLDEPNRAVPIDAAFMPYVANDIVHTIALTAIQAPQV